jgi:hypothetical protein
VEITEHRQIHTPRLVTIAHSAAIVVGEVHRAHGALAGVAPGGAADTAQGDAATCDRAKIPMQPVPPNSALDRTTLRRRYAATSAGGERERLGDFERAAHFFERQGMGLLDGLLGNASEIDPKKIQAEFAQVLASGEKIERAYQLIRDLFVFTDKRLILVDKQGITGSKIEYHSLPYRAITHFSIETGGHFDLDAELKIWVSGTAEPVQKQFNKKLNIYEVQSVLATYVLK